MSASVFLRRIYHRICNTRLTRRPALWQQARRWFSADLWQQTSPVRAELFSAERLEQHAHSLALAQPVISQLSVLQQARQYCRPALQQRLTANANTLLAAYRVSAAELQAGNSIVPAAEWLLDNYHIVEQQICEIRDDLPPGYYRQLPKLASGPLRGYPRVLGIAWAYVAHTDSHFDPATLTRFLLAYQQVQPLSIAELWAVAITLRIVLVENLRRLTDQISLGLGQRADADQLANILLSGSDWQPATRRQHTPLSDNFAAQLAKRLREQDPAMTPALNWLNQQLTAQDDSIDSVVLRAQQRLGASNVSVRNVITSMRRISAIDWTQLFESVSLVDRQLAATGQFSAMDFASRNLYRTSIEQLARRAKCAELTVAARLVQATREAAAQCSNPIQAQRQADCGYYLLGDGKPAFERQLGIKPRLRFWLSCNISRYGITGYISLFLLLNVSLVLLSGVILGVSGTAWLWLALLAVIPLSELTSALLQSLVSYCSAARTVPALALAESIGPEQRTLVAVPVLLSSADELGQHLQRLEEHYLANGTGEIT